MLVELNKYIFILNIFFAVNLLFFTDCSECFAENSPSSDLNIMVTDIVTSDFLNKNGNLDLSHLSIKIARFISGLQGYKAITKDESLLSLNESNKICKDLFCLMEKATISKADVVIYSELGMLTDRFIITSALIEVNEYRTLNQITYEIKSLSELNEIVIKLAAALLNINLEDVLLLPEISTDKNSYINDITLNHKRTIGIKDSCLIILNNIYKDNNLKVKQSEMENGIIKNISDLDSFKLVTLDMLLDYTKVSYNKSESSINKIRELSEIAYKNQIGYLSVFEITKKNDAVIIKASLIDSESTFELNRSSIIMLEKNLNKELFFKYAKIIFKRLFGLQSATIVQELDNITFKTHIKRLTESIFKLIKENFNNKSSKTAVLPFLNNGLKATKTEIGSQTTSSVNLLLRNNHKLETISGEKIEELSLMIDIPDPMNLHQLEVDEISTFLEIDALVLGRVRDLGNSFQITIKIIMVNKQSSLNKVIGFINYFMPISEKKMILDNSIFNLHTKSGALYRAVVPGWGQFYNGEEHYLKGGIILSGTVLSAIGATVTLILAYQYDEAAFLWSPGSKGLSNSYFKEYFLNGECDKYIKTGPDKCEVKSAGYSEQASTYKLQGYLFLSTTAAFYIWGFIDAGMNAEQDLR